MGPVPLPLRVKRFIRDPLRTVDPRRTAYRRLLRSVPADPQTFTEKLVHKLAFDRSPILRTFADKIAVRDFVSNRLGSEVLPTMYGVYDSVDHLDLDALPREFVLKAAHGSGAVTVVWERARRGVRPTADQTPTWAWREQIHPDDLDRTQLARLATGWLELSYELTFRTPEWAYSGLPPRLLAEEVLTDRAGELPSDYKFFMMHGKCTTIVVELARFGDHRALFLSPEWKVLPGNHSRGTAAEDVLSRPEHLDRMIEIAESLSSDVDFVRVDLYDLGDRIVFGELTNYPGGATGRYSSREFDLALGADWHLPRSYG